MSDELSTAEAIELSHPLRLLRDYAIPFIVWLIMIRFLCGQVVVPMAQSGMLTRLRRGHAVADEANTADSPE